MNTDDWRDQDPGVSQDDIRERAEQARVQERIDSAVRKARAEERRRAIAFLAVELGDLGDRQGFDLIAHLHAQRAWSLQTFGPGAAPANRAFERYANEALSGPSDDQDLDEIAGTMLVLFDGAMRAGHEPEAVAAALAEKLRVNQGRRWPAPGSVPEGEAVEHAKLCGTCHKPADEPSRFCSNAVHPRGEAKEGESVEHEEGGE